MSVRFKFIKILIILAVIFTGIAFSGEVLALDTGVEEVDNAVDLERQDPRSTAGRIINISLLFLGVIALGIILYAGFLWMTSEGNEEQVSKAKKILINGVIGLVIVLSSWGIASFVLNQLTDATQGGDESNISCEDGATEACGCGGTRTCVDGNWGSCVGSDCDGTSGSNSCDSSSIMSGCQADSSFCAEGYFCNDSDCSCEETNGFGENCDADGEGEDGSCTQPEDSRCGDNLTCNPDTCLCEGGPVIESVTPVGGFCENDINTACVEDSDCSNGECNTDTPNGAPDNLITIKGDNLSLEDETSTTPTVMFSDNEEGVSPQEINSKCDDGVVSSDILIVAVPEGAVTGPIEVVREDGLSDTTDNDKGSKIEDFVVNNIEKPSICKLDPQEARLGDTINYFGFNLNNSSAYFGNYDSKYSALSSSFSQQEGQAQVPNLESGDTTTFVKKGKTFSNYVDFSKLQEPEQGAYITDFSPKEGAPGQYVTIQGSGFGDFKDDSAVYFETTEANYEFPTVCADSVWQDDKIIVKVPSNIEDGSYQININIDGEEINTSELDTSKFKIDSEVELKPSLCKLEPERAAAESPVSLYGEYFGEIGQTSKVNFYYNKSKSSQVKEYEDNAQTMNATVPGDASTGPVKVVKNSISGNSVNLEIGECSSDQECGSQVCCPKGSYKEGRCVSPGNQETYQNCYSDIESSVYEWDFDTTVEVPEDTPYHYSCKGMSEDVGYCVENEYCPNSPGQCSTYPGGNQEVVGECDYSCETYEGCTENDCNYNQDLNKCVLVGNNEEDKKCDLDEKITYFNGEESALKTCNENNQWQIEVNTSCPEDWTRKSDGVCVDENSTCSLCPENLECINYNDGVCASKAICEQDATCNEEGECVKEDEEGCQCCCEIGEGERDCCAPLNCEGTCGSDQTDDGEGLGRCSGCANVLEDKSPEDYSSVDNFKEDLTDEEIATMDSACNCSSTSGKFCKVTEENPQGVCGDCSNIDNPDICQGHSSTCCVDAKNESSCRGGSGELLDGNCAYYDCKESDESQCDMSTPLIDGAYQATSSCETGCAEDGAQEDECNTLEDEECLNSGNCCLDANSTTTECISGEAITAEENEEDAGYCTYYQCKDSNPDQCATSTPVASSSDADILYEKEFTCTEECAQNIGSELGNKCVDDLGDQNTCDSSLCSDPFSCLSEEGETPVSNSNDCGTCCCDPNLPPEEDQCKDLNEDEDDNFSCMADKGDCSGEDRGLCCGCDTDDSCGSPTATGCGSDTCCRPRPNITTETPNHLENNVCANTIISAEFDKNMNTNTFKDNIVVLEKHQPGETCPEGTEMLAVNDSSQNNLENNLFTNLVSAFTNNLNSSNGFLETKSWFQQKTLAETPDPDSVYCSVEGSVNYENKADGNSRLIFKPKELLSPSSEYYVVIKGDKNLDSQNGVLDYWQIGYNGPGYWDPETSSYVEGRNISFNGVSFPNSYIWKFTTLPDQGNNGVCSIDHLQIEPSSYLFQTTDNDEDEEDSIKEDPSYDTVKDRDKEFVAKAFNEEDQRITPTEQYEWKWKWDIGNSDIVNIFEEPELPVTGEENKKLMVAQPQVTDANTLIKVTAEMSEDNEIYQEDQYFNISTPVYVFLCQNPWPPVDEETQEWSPWYDTQGNCNDALSGSNCYSYNYSIYYCRDKGSSATYDDLPAISDDSAVIRGASKICENSRSACDDDTDCPNGDCTQNLLKESYFFQQDQPGSTSIKEVKDLEDGGTLQLFWGSNSYLVDKYKIYYRQEGSKEYQTVEVAPEDIFNSQNSSEHICSPQDPSSEEDYSCNYLIKDLEVGTQYYFKVSALTEKNIESVVSDEVAGTPTDSVAPTPPSGLKSE